MSKMAKILVISIFIGVAVIGVYFGLKALRFGSDSGLDAREAADWVVVDDYYMPVSGLMEFIKIDGVAKGMLPVEVRNHGRNADLLRKFRGSKFVGPKVSVVELTYQGLEDWALVDLRTTNAEGQEIGRTVLYILYEGQWMIGDTGRIVE